MFEDARQCLSFPAYRSLLLIVRLWEKVVRRDRERHRKRHPWALSAIAACKMFMPEKPHMAP